MLRLNEYIKRGLYVAGKCLAAGWRPSFHDKQFIFHPVANFTDYCRYSQFMQHEYIFRGICEKSLVNDSNIIGLPGRCYVCNSSSSFQFSQPKESLNESSSINWREELFCLGCGLNNRMRAAIHIIEVLGLATNKSDKIYVTEQVTSFFQTISKRYSNVVGSEFLYDEIPFGTFTDNGIRNESLTNLSFANESFALIVSLDVLEHMSDYKAALSECCRCLTTEGALFFSVPFTNHQQTVVRAVQGADAQIQHLLPPEYHGDPMSEKGCLCFNHFGWDLVDAVLAAGFSDVKALFYWSREFGYVGCNEQIYFLATKGKSK